MTEGFFICPNCGEHIKDANIINCPNCTYDFGQLIECNYLSNNKCLLLNRFCKIKGLKFQECEVFNNMFHENLLPEI